jgi:L-ascorbate metabolism protein UlaG (beta-lactamase superfamily)
MGAGMAPPVGDGADAAVRHMLETSRTWSDGGALAFLIETPAGSILWKDTSGHWTGVLGGITADVALLAAAARPNVDGEPHQGSMASFLAVEAGMTKATRVALCHHDDWLPPFTGPLDVDPIRHRLGRDVPGAELLELDYLEGRRILG